MRWQLLGMRSPRHESWAEELGFSLRDSGVMQETCDGVLLINEGDEEGSDCMEIALAMRQSRPDLEIAVITPVHPHHSNQQARQLVTQESALPPAINDAQIGGAAHPADNLKVRYSPEMVTYEYQGSTGCRNS